MYCIIIIQQFFLWGCSCNINFVVLICRVVNSWTINNVYIALISFVKVQSNHHWYSPLL
nr:MAG TPA: hypothetical protein [Caudoviricetes sp.]